MVTQPCPNLSSTSGNLYGFGDRLGLDDVPVAGSFPSHHTSGFTLFAGHSLAVPLAGGVSLSIEVTTDSRRAPPVLYLYGPRDGDGVFGSCGKQVGVERGGKVLVLEFDVPAGQGGEYLVLVGTNPIARAEGGYSIRAQCEGDACGGAICEPLGACAVEVCFTGFVTEPHPNEAGLVCPTCECRAVECPGNMKLIVDTCVCDCAPELDPVCGVDGKTHKSACFAECKETQIARKGRCEDLCPELKGCAINLAECPFGPTVVDGCKECSCAANCNQTSGAYRPVCGTDGLTYLNAQRMACQTQDAAEPPGVLAVGACLPFCEPPADCALTCEFGYLPNGKVGADCYQCACMENSSSTEDCAPGGAQWCSVNGSFAFDASAASDLDLRLAQHRSFVSKCAAKQEGWKPVLGVSCPSGVCSPGEDCKRAADILKETFLRANAAPRDGPQVRCLAKFSGVPVCAFKPRRPCESNADCAAGPTCVTNSMGSLCQFDCACLNSGVSGVYDPVCVESGGDANTWYNACMAFCAGAWPPVYPGTCCTERGTIAERRVRQLEMQAFCAARGTQFTPRTFMDTACPPSAADCEADPDQCCFEGGHGPGGGMSGGGGGS